MDEDEQLRSAVARQRVRKTDRTVRLGRVAQQLMDERISPRQARFGWVVELWGRLLPAGLRRHCEIVDISGGQLKVQVDSPSYMYELRLCSSELLKELQQQCPRAQIKKIKLVVG